MATFHAAKGGISQKHRFYFTLPTATFHCATGAICAICAIGAISSDSAAKMKIVQF